MTFNQTARPNRKFEFGARSLPDVPPLFGRTVIGHPATSGASGLITAEATVDVFAGAGESERASLPCSLTCAALSVPKLMTRQHSAQNALSQALLPYLVHSVRVLIKKSPCR